MAIRKGTPLPEYVEEFRRIVRRFLAEKGHSPRD
jgi:hypothetical protein